MRTSNIQLRKLSRARHPTSNVQWRKRAWLSSLCALLVVAQSALSEEFPSALNAATAALVEGVPEVAVVRLQALLNRNLPDEQWRAAAEKLAEAFLAANQPGDALALLDDVRLRAIPSIKFWRAQDLASLDRLPVAGPGYTVVVDIESSTVR